MKWRNGSLRRRLVIWLLIPLLVISSLMLLEVRSNAVRSTNQAFDRALLSSALAIADRVVMIGGKIEVDVPYVALEMLTSAAEDRVFYQVSTGQGEFITGYEDLPPVPDRLLPLREEPVFYDAVYNGEPVRIGALSRYVASVRKATRFQVLVAETMGTRTSLSEDILASAAARQIVLIMLAAIIVWFGIGQGLKPLTRLEEALNRRSPTDLRPILHDVPTEVRHLVGAINQLFGRLENSLKTMQRFTADAAHQLRTPLAALRTQAELGQREDDPEKMRQIMETIASSTRQTSHLANQLLASARAAPEGLAGRPFEKIDLCAITRAVTSAKVPAAIENGIDLGYEGLTEPVLIMGDATLIEELLKNLVHNALIYCPDGSAVTVRLENDRKPGFVWLSVEDNGPGIPIEHHKDVFKRFYRMSESGQEEGCGLGLSIVKEIAARHDTKVKLTQPERNSGCVFSISFKRSS
ncbi:MULTISPECIES: sensor histidine kinase [unclassified Thalassospira]|uniref:sensor histidine kinase n=1 Tax=unclassified Thalassospira TaxID=2648997 RepID=UPI001AFE8767|nr:sensor histidine kinase [Thalassospira sp.]MBO6771066.1 sensor histidine kinase N-terminal domain-containing protein [Thalassospira sp.]